MICNPVCDFTNRLVLYFVNYYTILCWEELSEESLESRNNDNKLFREHHTKKNSRLNQNECIINMLVASLDSLILLTKKKYT